MSAALPTVKQHFRHCNAQPHSVGANLHLGVTASPARKPQQIPALHQIMGGG
jgi:hypothetical protein